MELIGVFLAPHYFWFNYLAVWPVDDVIPAAALLLSVLSVGAGCCLNSVPFSSYKFLTNISRHFLQEEQFRFQCKASCDQNPLASTADTSAFHTCHVPQAVIRQKCALEIEVAHVRKKRWQDWLKEKKPSFCFLRKLQLDLRLLRYFHWLHGFSSADISDMRSIQQSTFPCNYRTTKVQKFMKEIKCILELDNRVWLILTFLDILIDFLFEYFQLLRRKLKIKEEEHFWIEKKKQKESPAYK